MARLANTLVGIEPEYTITYAAAPYKNAADYTIWGEIENTFREVMANHSDVYADIQHIPSVNKCIYAKAGAKAGRIELVGVDRVARLQGAKSQDPEKGFLYVVADEIAVFQTQAFLEILDNITANLNFLCTTGCNFKNPLGLDGSLCNPRGAEFSDLQTDRDFCWYSDYNSITLRLDGHRSPNVETKRVIYPFLLTEKKRRDMEENHGRQGPKYLEQVRSFPNLAASDNFVLSMEQLRSGGAFDHFWEKTAPWIKVAFCDPGWVGDPCKIGGFEFGPARVQTHDGSMQDSMLIQPVSPIRQLNVESGKVADSSFMARLSKHSNTPVMLKEGREVTMDCQIALQCSEYLEEFGIPRENFAFDASCRGAITQEMLTVLGTSVTAYDFQGAASSMVVDASGTLARDRYRNLRTEMYMLVQLVVLAGQFRGAEVVRTALSQICRHRYHQVGSKIAVEPKDEYKKMNQNKSPDDADVIVGSFHMARRRGLPLSHARKPASNALSYDLSNLEGIRPRPKIHKLRKR